MGQTQIVMAILVGLGILGGIASLATIYYGVDSSTSGIKENSPKASQNAKDIQKHANHLSIAEDKKANSVNNRLPLNTEDSTSGYIQTDFPRGSFYILDDYLNDTLSESYALEDESNNKVKITYIKETQIIYYIYNNASEIKDILDTDSSLSLVTYVEKDHETRLNTSILLEIELVNRYQDTEYFVFRPNRDQIMFSQGIKMFHAKISSDLSVLVNICNESTSAGYDQTSKKFVERINYLRSKPFMYSMQDAIYNVLKILNLFVFQSLYNFVIEKDNMLDSSLELYAHRLMNILFKNKIDIDYLKWNNINPGLYRKNNLASILQIIGLSKSNVTKEVEEFLESGKANIEENLTKYQKELDIILANIKDVIPDSILAHDSTVYTILNIPKKTEDLSKIHIDMLDEILRLYNALLNLSKDHEIAKFAELWDRPIILAQEKRTVNSSTNRAGTIYYAGLNKPVQITSKLLEKITNGKDPNVMLNPEGNN